MKQHNALELFGFCESFLDLLALPWSPDAAIQPEPSRLDPCPVDRYETGPDYRPGAGRIVQPEVAASDDKPDARA
jgi:hypothetical protein